MINASLLSIRPRFAERILDGGKRIELRRRPPRERSASLVAIYATAPTSALVGFFVAQSIVSGSPEELWRQFEDVAGLSWEEYSQYFSGACTAFGLTVSRVIPLADPIELEEIEASWPGFRAPQSFSYLMVMPGASDIGVIRQSSPQHVLRVNLSDLEL